MKYVVYTMITDLDEDITENNSIKIVNNVKKARKLMEELLEEVIENYNENESYFSKGSPR